MPVLTWRDKLRIAAGVARQLVAPGPKLCFDGAELARFDGGENLETWSRRVLGERGTNYITVPYMGFLYAVPMSWLSPALFHAVVKQFYRLALSVPPKGVGQVCHWLVEGTPGLDLRLATPVDKITQDGAGFTITAGGEPHPVDAVIVAPEPGVAADLLEDLVEPESTKNCATACTPTTRTSRSATSATRGHSTVPAWRCPRTWIGTGAPACYSASASPARFPRAARPSACTSTPHRWNA